MNVFFFIIIVDVDDERRRMLRTKVKQGLAGAEILKRRMRTSPINSRSTLTTSSPSENCKFLFFKFYLFKFLFLPLQLI